MAKHLHGSETGNYRRTAKMGKKDISITFTSADDRPFDQALKNIINIKAGGKVKTTFASESANFPADPAADFIKREPVS